MGDDSSNSKTDSGRGQIVLGQEWADAREAEKRLRETGGAGDSPMPESAYDFWRGDLSLINPRSNPLDHELRSLCRKYVQSKPDTRLSIRRSITMDQFYTLINFARRSSVFGIREAKSQLVIDGLTAVSMIEMERVDYRDILCCLALLYHAAEKSNGAAEEIFRNAAVIAEKGVADLITGFTEQTAEYRNLSESWGLVEVDTEDGPGFIGWGLSDYNPQIDLRPIIIEISKFIESGNYMPDQIEVATELPEVWLGGEDEKKQTILSNVRGCATLSARLRPEVHPDHSSQQFTVFLVETAGDRDAELLLKAAGGKKALAHASLAVAELRLFCLVVARSWVEGVDSFETSESLKRFSPGISEILVLHGR